MSQNLFTTPSIIACVTEIVSSHLSNNAVPVADVPLLIRSVHATLGELDPTLVMDGYVPALSGADGQPGHFRFSDVQPAHQTAAVTLVAKPLQPAVPVEDSVQHEYIVCLEDGKRLRMLKRYLRSRFGMSPEDYRVRWNLPKDYPMAAPAVIEQRREHAAKAGLGRKPGAKSSAVTGRSVGRPRKGKDARLT